MVASRTGTAVQIDASGATSGTSSSFTVPANCTLIIAQWHYWDSNSNVAMSSLSIDGDAFTLDVNVADTGNVAGRGTASLQNPSTGTQTLAWNWGSGGARAEGGKIILTFITGNASVNPIRDTDSAGATSTTSVAATVDSETTDIIIASCQSFSSGGPPAIDGTVYINNASLNDEVYDASEVAGSATSTTVNMTGESSSSIVAVSIKESAVVSDDITLVGSTGASTDNATSVSHSLPSGVQDDDLILWFGSCDGIGFNIPSGFTQIYDVDTAGTHNNKLAYRVASSEPASYTVTTESSISERGHSIFAVYRNVDTADPINGNTSNTGGSNTTAVFTSLTPDADDCAVVAFVGLESGNEGLGVVSAWPSTIVEQLDNTNGPPGTGNGSSAGAFGDVIQTTAAAVSGNATLLGGATNWGAMLVALNKAASGGAVTETFDATIALSLSTQAVNAEQAVLLDAQALNLLTQTVNANESASLESGTLNLVPQALSVDQSVLLTSATLDLSENTLQANEVIQLAAQILTLTPDTIEDIATEGESLEAQVLTLTAQPITAPMSAILEAQTLNLVANDINVNMLIEIESQSLVLTANPLNANITAILEAGTLNLTGNTIDELSGVFELVEAQVLVMNPQALTAQQQVLLEAQLLKMNANSVTDIVPTPPASAVFTKTIMVPVTKDPTSAIMDDEEET